jgi:hypothetical protein
VQVIHVGVGQARSELGVEGDGRLAQAQERRLARVAERHDLDPPVAGHP